MSHLARIARSTTIVACTIVATTAVAAGSTASAAGTTPALDCDPIACAAAYIGVPPSTLAADIVNATGRDGMLGTQVAVDQLDAAEAGKLTAIAPKPSAALVSSYWVVIADHDAIRDALLDQATADLLPAAEG